MAISKEKKKDIIGEYEEWLGNSKALIITEYTGLTTTDLDRVRRQVRDAGGEFHIVKNTLSKIALESAGYTVQEGFFEGSTAIGFAFDDGPALAKVINDLAKSSDFMTIKGGYLGKDLMQAGQVSALADLPPLPVMRARLMGVIQAPAGQLARLIREPARQLAQVIKAHSEQEAAQA